MPWPSRLLCAVVVVMLAGAGRGALARAEPARHAAYLELLGKGSLWGLGYDHQLSRWFSVGGLASFFVLRGERFVIASPYLGLYPLGHDRHRLFVHGGPQWVRKSSPAPVPELPGKIESGLAAEVSLGYEYRHGVLVRGFGMVTAGQGGVYPWLGVSLGWAW